MNLPSIWVLVLAGALGGAVLFIRSRLRRLKSYEAKEHLKEIKDESNKTVSNTPLDALLAKSNRRRNNTAH